MLGHLKSRLDVVKNEFKRIQSELDAFFLEVPNIPDDSVPEGGDESANLELRRWRPPPSFDFEAKDHVELAQGRIDLESAAKITGSRYAVMYGPLVRLHRASGSYDDRRTCKGTRIRRGLCSLYRQSRYDARNRAASKV